MSKWLSMPKFNNKAKQESKVMPEPNFENNWRQEHYNDNVKQGVAALQKGTSVNIMEDGRAFELACDIKRQFILEYQKQLADSIVIDKSGNLTTIKFKHDNGHS